MMMILNEEQMLEFEKVSKPLIEFLNNLPHPHVSATVGCSRSELFESVSQFVTEDYIKN